MLKNREENYYKKIGITNDYMFSTVYSDAKRCKELLALRSRYYHSEMDGHQIKAGVKYRKLKRSIVIFICDFDMFGLNRSIYTFETMCREDSNIVLLDKRQTTFVNLNGDRGDVSTELDCLLEYLATWEPKDAYTNKCQKEVERLRMDDEWRENYMTLEMKMDERYETGLEVGMQAGRKDALKCLIEKKLKKGKSIEQIAEECEESVDGIQQLIQEME